MALNFNVPMSNFAVLSGGNGTGICMSLSTFWIQRCRQLNAVPGPFDLFFTNWRNYETMAVTFETLLGDYNAATGGDGLINTQPTLQNNSLFWHDLFSTQLNLPAGEVNWGTSDTLDYLVSLMDSSIGRGYFLTGYRTSQTGIAPFLLGGHTVAFWYEAPGANKTFMDPNFGQWGVARNYHWTAEVIQHLLHYYQNFNQWVLIAVG